MSEDRVDDALEDRLQRLAELIAASPHNLVSRGDRADVYGTHIHECAAYAGALALEDGARWVDVGTGAGLPGLVLATIAPATSWLLIDSTAKKCAAVRGFADALGLRNVTVLQGRAEELAHEPELRASADGVISRAVAPLVTLVELLTGFAKAGAAVVAAKGPAWPEELERATPALPLLGLEFERAIPVPSARRPTALVMMRQRSPVPLHYPRRSGMPRSQPLGGA